MTGPQVAPRFIEQPQSPPAGERLRATTPLVRSRAAARGVDLDRLRASGVGRVGLAEVDTPRRAQAPAPTGPRAAAAGAPAGGVAEFEIPGECGLAEVAHGLVHRLRDLGVAQSVQCRTSDGRLARIVAADEAINLSREGLGARLADDSRSWPSQDSKQAPGETGGLHVQDLVGSGIRRAVPPCRGETVVAVLGDVEQVLRPVEIDGHRAIATTTIRQVLVASRSQEIDALVLVHGLAGGAGATAQQSEGVR